MNNTHLDHFPRVVAIGGGHGLGRVLSALSFLGSRLTGIVTTTDNGGSSGRLRQAQGCIAWGDLRNCLNQLVTEPTIGSLLFEHRFSGQGELAGHNLGNLMLLALDNLCVRPLDAIRLISDMLKIETQLLPMSETPTDLCAQLYCGNQIIGEIMIDQLATPPQALTLAPNVSAPQEAIAALRKANLIILGPGSFLTSIMPPLLQSELAAAIGQSHAKVIFISNLVAEAGPASQMDLTCQCQWLESYLGKGRIDGILAPKTATLTLPWQARLYRDELGEANLSHRHDREKLKSALARLLDEIAPELCAKLFASCYSAQES